jgi:Tol biopolymer transport system component
VIVTGNGSSLHNGLLKMNADGSERSTLFDDPERNVLAPAWSPAGDRIAFGIGTFFQATFGQPMPAVVKGADIGLINSDSTGFKLLTKGDGNYAFPSWSSDGRQIVVRALTTNGKGLSLIDVSTGAIKTLTTGYNDTLPAWSPKGDLIAFSSNRDGDFDIYRIDVNGAGIKRLTDTPGNDAHCAWSPDGEWLAFSSARGGFKDEAALHPHNPQPYGDLYVMRSDGSDARQLTDDQYEDGTVAFVPISSVQDDRSSGRR